MSHEIEYWIYKHNVKEYQYYKKLIPCFNGCAVYPMCCEESKPTASAKQLVYRISLKNPCEKAIEIFEAIKRIPQLKKRIAYCEKEMGRCRNEIEEYEATLKKLANKSG